MIKQITSNRFIKNTGWMVGERVFQMAISLVVGMLTARYLGPENQGIINYSASFVSLFTVVCTLGLEGVIIKHFVDSPQREGTILFTGIVMRCTTSFISVFFINLIVRIANPNDKILFSVTLAQSISLLFRSFELIEYWYQSKLRSKYVTIIKTTAYVIVSIYKVFLLILKADVIWFAFSNTIDIVLIALFLVFSYIKSNGFDFRFSFSTGKLMISQSHHFILSGLMVTIYGQMDKICIGNMLDNRSVGLYSTAISICALWDFIPLAIINSARPVIMEEKKKNNEKYIKLIKLLYSCIIWLCIIYSSFITIFSKTIIMVLYGDQYIGASTALSIAVWSSIFSLIGSARGIWILCENYNKYVKKYIFWGAVVNIPLNVLLIPYIGIEGSAVATLVTQLTTCLIAPLFYKETRIHTKYVIESFLLKGVRSSIDINLFRSKL